MFAHHSVAQPNWQAVQLGVMASANIRKEALSRQNLIRSPVIRDCGLDDDTALFERKFRASMGAA
jgi:hypothetical protein